MTIEVKVPILPESVADAVLLDWIKQVGDHVERDEILTEIETDKVVLEIPAPASGLLSEIVQTTGATVSAQQVLARIDTEASGAQAEKSEISTDKSNTRVRESQSSRTRSDDNLTSPAVRRLAAETGIDLKDIDGNGRDGRINKEDVLTYISNAVAPQGSPPSQNQTSQQASPTQSKKTAIQPDKKPASDIATNSLDATVINNRSENRIPMSRLRQTIAHRLVQSQQTAALLTTFNEVNMQNIIDLRTRYKNTFIEKHGSRLGFMSFFVKASSLALQRFPLVNAYIESDEIVQHNYSDISIAVSTPRGLVAPVLRNCESLNYAEIENKIDDFSERAQKGKISIEELTGGTFTITNGGVFGSLVSTPIVNPPQSAILGMHKIQKRPVVEDDEIVVRPMMYLALSYDHRIIDGKDAVKFLVDVKTSLEDPNRILLDC